MPRSSFLLMLAAVVVSPLACARSPSRGSSDRAAGASQGKPERADPVSEALRVRLARPRPPAYAVGDAAGSETWAAVRRLYETNGHQPVWLASGRPRPEIGILREAVRASAQDGLNPADYDMSAADTLAAAKEGGLFKKRDNVEAQLDADVRLSYAFLKFASHLERGRVPPGQVDEHWFGQQREGDLAQILKVSLDSGKLGDALDGLRSQHPQYAALKKVLARYRDAQARGGWAALPVGLTLRPGKPDPHVAALRAHLTATGDLVAPADPATVVFDAETHDALKRFERGQGLTPDGRMGRAVLAALNVPVEERIRQIELNLERWRWLPESLGDRYVLVNIPTFHLTAVDHGQAALQMRVVTGKHESPTPIFSDEMTTVVFSPYWNVPRDIARNETIPAVMRDPSYLARNNLEAVRGGRVVDPWSVDWSRAGNVQLRQRPGPRNALGGVKFVFPNQFDVYFHDTPADALFARVERDYSHGCVRLEKPFEMAQWVLQDRPEWTPEKIKAAMSSGREQHVALKQAIPVYIVYQTVWVDEDGTVQFRDDVYGHDAQQERILPASPMPAGIRVADQNARPQASMPRLDGQHVADAR
jgi:L,D-transpeptidase YcbB